MSWSEDWIEDRVRWRFGQSGREGSEWTPHAAVWEAVPSELQDEVVALATVRGRPLVLFGSSSERWTLLTSREVISLCERQLTAVELKSIRSVVATLPDGEAAKFRIEYLSVRTRRGSQSIWGPPGPRGALVLLSLLDMLQPH